MTAEKTDFEIMSSRRQRSGETNSANMAKVMGSSPVLAIFSFISLLLSTASASPNYGKPILYTFRRIYMSTVMGFEKAIRGISLCTSIPHAVKAVANFPRPLRP